MADEISLNVNLSIVNGTFKEDIRPGLIQIDQAAVFAAGGIQSVGTSEEALGVTDIAALGVAFFQNLDATNFVTIGTFVSGTYYPAMKLKAGEYGAIRLVDGLTYYAKADAAAVKLYYRIYNN